MRATEPSQRTFFKVFGPGLLFAGAAVGVSHLVQSTRAGAIYGFGLILFVVFANVIKYPAFAFGPWYAAATGTSLLEGYRRRGRFALVAYAGLTLTTMLTVQAAVTIVTAGLAKALMQLSASPLTIAVAITLLCAVIVAVGDFRWLDRIMKVVVATLTLATLFATILVLPDVDWGGLSLWPTGQWYRGTTALFIAALIGWMPSAIDISVWHSLWTLARRRDTRHAPSLREARLDFSIGYWGTAALALCFVVLGTVVMHQQDVAPTGSAGGFATQVIALYTQSLGDWARPIIGTCALLVMFSTTLTVIDGWPRVLSTLVARFRGPEQAGADRDEPFVRWIYWIVLGVVAVGTYVVLRFFSGRLLDLVDLATTLSFLTAPFLALMNHLAVFGPEVPVSMRPSPAMRRFSIVGIAFLTAFAGVYPLVRWGVL